MTSRKHFSTSQNLTWSSTRENLSIDVSITIVGLKSTKPGRFLFSAYRHSGHGQNSISNFFEKIQIFGVSMCCSICEDLSIALSITNAGLISTKPERFLFSVYRQNSISNIFEKKSTFWVSMLYYL